MVSGECYGVLLSFLRCELVEYAKVLKPCSARKSLVGNVGNGAVSKGLLVDKEHIKYVSRRVSVCYTKEE